MCEVAVPADIQSDHASVAPVRWRSSYRRTVMPAGASPREVNLAWVSAGSRGEGCRWWNWPRRLGSVLRDAVPYRGRCVHAELDVVALACLQAGDSERGLVGLGCA